MTQRLDKSSLMNKFITFSCLFMAVIILGNLYFRKPNTYPTVNGIVESSGSINSSGIFGGTIEIAMVRLSDGTLVQAQVKTGYALNPGDNVTLSSKPVTFGPSQFEILSITTTKTNNSTKPNPLHN